MYSYDTEALNKTFHESKHFSNAFQDTGHTKINYGVQQLYIIGSYW